jgi:hypothetical protein
MVKTRWNQKQATVKQNHMRRVRHGLPDPGQGFKKAQGFRTRTHGTSKQVGKIFPTRLTAKMLPKVSYPKLRRGSYLLRVLFKDGTVKNHRIKALGPDSAIDSVDSYLHQFEGKKKVKELSLLAGSKVGDPQQTVATAAGPDAGQEIRNKIAGWFNPENMSKTAEKVGHVFRTPSRVSAAFQRGYSGYDPKEEERLRREIRLKTLRARAEEQPCSRAELLEMRRNPNVTRPYAPSQTMGAPELYGRAQYTVSPEEEQSTALALRERIDRAIRKNSAPVVFNYGADTRDRRIRTLKELDNELDAISSVSRNAAMSPSDKIRLQIRLKRVESEIRRAGGKVSKQRQKRVSFKTTAGKKVSFLAAEGGKTLTENVYDAIALGRRLIGES